MSERRAAIDIGTNSVRLLIADAVAAPDGGPVELVPVIRRTLITRLGEGVDAARRLDPGARKRTIGALLEYEKEIREHGARSVRVVATSALRDAVDADDFVRELGRVTGFEVFVLTGDQEARTAFAGATSVATGGAGPDAFVSTDEKVAVVDVGGGSTEIIFGHASRPPEGLESLDIGSVRLTELFVRHDPPTRAELDAIRDRAHRIAAPALRRVAEVGVGRMIAVAGTATTLAAIGLGLTVYDPDRVHGYGLDRERMEAIIERLSALSLAERRTVAGLEPQRADIIIAGSLILLEIVEGLGLAELTVSERDLLDGLILGG